MWGSITYPFPNFLHSWSLEWISNFVPHFTGYVITYPHHDYELLHVSKSAILGIVCTNVVSSSIWPCGFHFNAMSWEILNTSLLKICLTVILWNTDSSPRWQWIISGGPSFQICSSYFTRTTSNKHHLNTIKDNAGCINTCRCQNTFIFLNNLHSMWVFGWSWENK